MLILFQAKLEARRARRMAEAQRLSEEEEAQRIIAEQQKLMMRQTGAQAGGVDPNLAHVPTVKYAESVEEQALKKEQVCLCYLVVLRMVSIILWS